MKVLVLYATVEGHTRKIAKTLAAEFEAINAEVDLTAVLDPGYCDPGNYDAAILCAPIHIGKYPSDFVKFITGWKLSLQSVPTALVTVSLSIASKNEDERLEAQAYPEKLTQKTGWKPDYLHHAAGALKYLEYDFFKRWMLRRITKSEGGSVDTTKDHELTDWEALKSFTQDFAKKIPN